MKSSEHRLVIELSARFNSIKLTRRETSLPTDGPLHIIGVRITFRGFDYMQLKTTLTP